MRRRRRWRRRRISWRGEEGGGKGWVWGGGGGGGCVERSLWWSLEWSPVSCESPVERVEAVRLTESHRHQHSPASTLMTRSKHWINHLFSLFYFLLSLPMIHTNLCVQMTITECEDDGCFSLLLHLVVGRQWARLLQSGVITTNPSLPQSCQPDVTISQCWPSKTTSWSGRTR